MASYSDITCGRHVKLEIHNSSLSYGLLPNQEKCFKEGYTRYTNVHPNQTDRVISVMTTKGGDTLSTWYKYQLESDVADMNAVLGNVDSVSDKGHVIYCGDYMTIEDWFVNLKRTVNRDQFDKWCKANRVFKNIRLIGLKLHMLHRQKMCHGNLSSIARGGGVAFKNGQVFFYDIGPINRSGIIKDVNAFRRMIERLFTTLDADIPIDNSLHSYVVFASKYRDVSNTVPCWLLFHPWFWNGKQKAFFMLQCYQIFIKMGYVDTRIISIAGDLKKNHWIEYLDLQNQNGTITKLVFDNEPYANGIEYAEVEYSETNTFHIFKLYRHAYIHYNNHLPLDTKMSTDEIESSIIADCPRIIDYAYEIVTKVLPDMQEEHRVALLSQLELSKDEEA